MSYSDDSLLTFINQGKQKSIKGSELYFQFERYYITYLSRTSQFKEAIQLANDLLLKVKNTSLKRGVELEKCRTLIRNNRIKEAIELSLQVANSTLKEKDTLQCLTAYSVLGWANMDLEHYKDAILYLEKGISICQNPIYFEQNPFLFSNLASCYNNIREDKKAFKMIDLAIYYSKKGENLTALANALSIRADMHIHAKEPLNAMIDMESALKIREKIGNDFYIISDLGQLSFIYAKNNQTKKGIELAEKGIELANKHHSLSKLIYLQSALVENYKVSDNLKQYAESMAKLIELKDSLNSYNNEEAFLNIKNFYDIQSKDHMIELQKIELKQHKNFIVGIIVFFTLLIALLVSLYFNYKNLQKRKMQQTIDKQEQAIHDAEENERKRIAADLHDNIGAHAGAIKSSIRYLKDGLYNQNEILGQLDQNASDMVTHLNDTIWILKSEKLLLTNMFDRYKLWKQRLLANYPEIEYEINENITEEIEFSPNKILNLFSSLKELVTNCIKHSQCTSITTEISSNSNGWKISIKDNGIGINPDNFNKGNGITNLKHRAEISEWQIDWKNEEGTSVTLRSKK